MLTEETSYCVVMPSAEKHKMVQKVVFPFSELGSYQFFCELQRNLERKCMKKWSSLAFTEQLVMQWVNDGSGPIR